MGVMLELEYKYVIVAILSDVRCQGQAHDKMSQCIIIACQTDNFYCNICTLCNIFLIDIFQYSNVSFVVYSSADGNFEPIEFVMQRDFSEELK